MAHDTYPQSFDVAVVGAGPAGSTAAWHLARAGAGVVLLEARMLPRARACAGGVIGRARAALPEGLAYPWEHTCPVAQLHLPGALLHFQVERAEPLVSMVNRAEFDLVLARGAEAVGAQLREHCRTLAVHHRGNRLEIDTSAGRLSTRFVVIADGALSPTAALAGWRREPLLVPAIEWAVQVDAETLARHHGIARFDLDEVDPGYAWIFPKRETLTAGILAARRGSRGLKAALGRYLARLGITPQVPPRTRGAVLPLTCREPLTRGRALVIGDAAGLVDPLLGEGLSFALKSAALAARAILHGRFDPWLVQHHYESAMAEEVLGELRLARTLSRLLYGQRRVRDWLLQRSGQSLTEAMAEVVSGRATLRGLVRSPANWGRLLWHSG